MRGFGYSKFEATVLWLVVLAVTSIFKDGWMVWIFATLMWFNYICEN
jgi:hypothetical protein